MQASTISETNTFYGTAGSGTRLLCLPPSVRRVVVTSPPPPLAHPRFSEGSAHSPSSSLNLHSSPPIAPGPHSSLLRPAPRCPSPTGSWGLHDSSLDGSAGLLPGRGRPVVLTPQSSHFSDSAPHGDVDRSKTQLAQLTGARWAPPGPPRKDVTKAGPIGCRWHAGPSAVGVVCIGHA